MVERRLENRIVRDEFLRRAVADLIVGPWDLFIAYYRIPDLLSHSLWKYHDPEAFEHPPTEEELQWFGESVKQSYRFVDEALGELMAGLDGEANLVVVSDHGFGRAAAHKMEDENAPVKYLSGDHRPDGIILASGPDIQPGQIEGLTIMEIAPTLVALMGLPVSGELPGQVATGLLRPDFFEDQALATVADYSYVEMPHRESRPDTAAQEDEMNTLKGLGYVGEGVAFDADSVAGEFDFWGSDERLVAGHIASEVVYHLIQGNVDLAQDAVALMQERRPDSLWRVMALSQQKFDILMERLPEGAMDPAPFHTFFESYTAPVAETE